MSKKNWVREELSSVVKAAERGIVPAKIELAKRYFTGRDVSRNPQEGFTWASSAAEGGNPEAQLILGHCYATGTGVQASGRTAYDLFVKAALQGNAVAMYNLAICFDYGIGIGRDGRISQKLYRRSAEMGCARAKHVLVAQLWNKDTDDVQSKRRDNILKWYAARANRGDELAKRNLAQVRRNRKAQFDKELAF